MKKLIGVILALMVAVTGFAFAETAGAPAKTAEGYLLIEFEQADGDSLALIGAGSGADAFDAFAFGAESYSERFDNLWKALSLLEPAMTLEGSVANLCFEPSLSGDKTQVTLNGVVVAQLKGLETFAILSGEDRPAVKADCDVRLWTAGTTGTVGGICANCGEVDDGSEEHDNVISQFCDENHTECMGDPVHRCDSCGKDYPCSKSNSHTECAVCGKPWCYKDEGDHVELECGHRGCEIYGDEDAHALCLICGGYLCDGEDHTAAECGLHHAADEGDHSALACGHHACEVGETDAGKHAACEEGDGYLCDGLNHNHADEIPEGEVTVEGDAAA